MKTKPKALTPAEQKYIKQMFEHPCKTIADLLVGEVVLFLENREEAPKTKWPLDHSISEKFLRFHKLPLTLTAKSYDKRHLPKLQRAEDKRLDEEEDYATRTGLLAGN